MEYLVKSMHVRPTNNNKIADISKTEILDMADTSSLIS